MAKPDPVLLDTTRYPVHLEMATRFQDLDANNHINNVALAAIFEDIRVRFDTLLGHYETLRTTGLRTVIASVQIEYLGEAFYPQPISAHVGTLEIGRSSWTVASVTTQGPTLISFMRGTIVNMAGASPSPIPESFRDALTRHKIRV